ncbi:hypothetical protein BC834DRAFT_609288 [Gloeopeniophorella convolvens]|nr:hypothetical protein BC834DRAFT_609288 [Gloeopeniophorella convolvens]
MGLTIDVFGALGSFRTPKEHRVELDSATSGRSQRRRLQSARTVIGSLNYSMKPISKKFKTSVQWPCPRAIDISIALRPGRPPFVLPFGSRSPPRLQSCSGIGIIAAAALVGSRKVRVSQTRITLCSWTVEKAPASGGSARAKWADKERFSRVPQTLFPTCGPSAPSPV